MMTLSLLAAVAFGGDDFLAKSDDMEKAPCVILMSPPANIGTDARVIKITNQSDKVGIVPSIAGFCGPGKAEIADEYQVMQTILDPDRSTKGHPVVLPILAPAGTAFPNFGYIVAPAATFHITGVAYAGVWTSLYELQVQPGWWVDVFDDDPSLDIGDHMYMGVCANYQEILVGVHDEIHFGGACSPNELAKSRRVKK